MSVACEGNAGVVLDPVRDELFARGRRGAADARRRAAGAVGDRDDLATALVATGFGYEAGVRAAQGKIVARLLPQVRDIRRAGQRGARPRLDRGRAATTPTTSTA